MLVLGLAVSVAASGCSPRTTETTDKPAEAKAVKGGTLNYYINEPAYIDPYNTQESEGTNVEQMLFDSLTTIEGETNKVIPAAAESWTANADNSVFTFKLVPGAMFHDGTPVTAESFVFAWTRISDPKTNPKDPSVISYHLSAVKGYADLQEGKATTLAGVKAVDDTTFEVTLDAPFADFPYVAAHPALAPVPADAVANGVDVNGENVPFAEMPVGNGPFKMTEPWKHDQYIKVARNEDYYGEKANLDAVNFSIFKDEETAFREFQAGTVDFTSIPSGQVKATIEQFGEAADGYTVNPAKQVLLGAETAVYYIVLNNKDKSLANPDVRKAINLAINRQAICDSIFEGTRKPATNIVPPGVVGYEDGTWKDARYDVEGAKAALTAAGFPEGKGVPELTLSFNSGSGHEDIMQLVQADLAKVGIKSKLQGAEWAQYLKQLDEGDFTVARLGWIADYPIFDNFLYPIFDSKSGDNKAAFADPAVDAALVAARQEGDEAKRIAAYQAINETIQATDPVVPMMYYAHRHVGSARVNNLYYSPMGLAALDKCWVTDGAAE